MECLAPTHIIYRSLSVMTADAQSPLDLDERTALIAWFQGLESPILILLPDDVLPKLVRYIGRQHPELLEALLDAVPLSPLDKGMLLAACMDSPLEIDFHLMWEEQSLHLLYPLSPQFSLKEGQYRLDFAYPPLKVGIELDGYTYHSDREAFTRDRQRQRQIEALGWKILRFSGDELRKDLLHCINECVHVLGVEKYRQAQQVMAQELARKVEV